MSAQSLILVTVDCLRADHVGFLGYSRPTTPFLDSLAAESFVVPNAIVAGAPTYFSFPAIFASRHPLSLGRDVFGIAPGETTIASYLKQCGFATACFLAANPYLSPQYGYQYGFDVFKDFLDQDTGAGTAKSNGDSGGARRNLNQAIQNFCRRFGPLSKLYSELYFQYGLRTLGPASLDALRPFPAADVIVDHALSWLETVASQPFFLWLHFMDPHAPHCPPEAAMSAIGARPLTPARVRYLNAYWNRWDIGPHRFQKHREEIIDLYDGGIRWVDIQIGRFVGRLEDLGLWNRCLFALTADHGEEFLEHDGRFHSPWSMKEEMIHVPLLVRSPGLAGVRVGEMPFSHVDLAPTLIDSLGLQVPSEFRGQSFWHKWQLKEKWEQPAIVDTTECYTPSRRETRRAPRVLCVRENRYKLILRLRDGRDELFDLQTDPGETRPLPDHAEREVRRRLLAHAQRHLQNTIQNMEIEQRLRGRLQDLVSNLSPSTGSKGGPVNVAAR